MSVAVIDRNDVVLRGRLSAPAEQRSMPSGDVAAVFRLKVARAPRRGRRPAVDTLDCITYDRGLVRRALQWQPEDVVEVEGALQRRFWRRADGSTGQAYEVNCRKGRKVLRPAGRADARTA